MNVAYYIKLCVLRGDFDLIWYCLTIHFIINAMSFPYFSLLNFQDAKEVAESTREGMPPIIIFKGQAYSPDDFFISGEQELLFKIKIQCSRRYVDDSEYLRGNRV